MLLGSVQPTVKENCWDVQKRCHKTTKQTFFFFASALRNAILKVRQKKANILVVGPTNCGKSFLLNPIELMFKAFVNPTTVRYVWVDLDECEVDYLNNFRWSTEIIAWSEFLFLLEDQTVTCNWHVHTTGKHNSFFCYQQGTNRVHWQIRHLWRRGICHNIFTLAYIQFYTLNRDCKKYWPLQLLF